MRFFKSPDVKWLVPLISLLINSCDTPRDTPMEPQKESAAFLSDKLPYLAPPRLYLTVDFEKRQIGITIIDTTRKQSPDSLYVSLTTSRGDQERILLGHTSASFTENITGFSGLVSFVGSTSPQKGNGILEVDTSLDKVSLVYESFNDNNRSEYSIVVSGLEVFFPPRWPDRLP